MAGEMIMMMTNGDNINELCNDPILADTIKFHGHLCPGLLIGYRASLIGLDRIGTERSEDEEIVAIIENDSCSADAVQVITGCTFGKGNLKFNDYGKQVFTFALRPGNKAVRIVYKHTKNAEDEDRDSKIAKLLKSRDEDLFDIKFVDIDIPEYARIYESIPCDVCGESAMESRIVLLDGRNLCIPCAKDQS